MMTPNETDVLRIWKADPVRFVRDMFSVEPDLWQQQALRALVDPGCDRIAMQACAGPGKSAVEAWGGWHFMVTESDGVNHPNGAVISITADNLKNGLWKELAVWRARSPFLMRCFEMTAESIFAREHPKTWFLNFRSFAKSADQEAQGRALSGLHAKSILYLIDEAGDMPPAVLRSAEQGLSNCTYGKIVMAGNPTSHDGALFLAVNAQAHMWKVIRVTGDPDDAMRSPRISLEWAQQQIQLYGRENPWVMAYILGKFPPSSINALLGPDEVNAAMTRGIKEHQYSFAQKRIGLDVARFGDDATSFSKRQGLRGFGFQRMRNARTHEIAARLIKIKTDFGSEMEFIDSTGGWGAGVEDACLLAGVALVPVNFSGRPDDPRYFNKRSEIIFKAAEWVKRGGVLEHMPSLIPQATAATYWFEKGKLRVEEKDQIKARIGMSPDDWDAFCVTFAVEDMPAHMGDMAGIGGRTREMQFDYNPFAESAA